MVTPGFRHFSPRVVLSILFISQSLIVEAHDRSPLRARRDDVHHRALNMRDLDHQALDARQLGGLVGDLLNGVGDGLGAIGEGLGNGVDSILAPLTTPLGGQPTPSTTPTQTRPTTTNPGNPGSTGNPGNPGNPGTTTNPGQSPTNQPTTTGGGGQNPSSAPNGGNGGGNSSTTRGANNSGNNDENGTSRDPLGSVSNPSNGGGNGGKGFSTPPPVTLTFVTTDETGQERTLTEVSTPAPVPIDDPTENKGSVAKGPIIAGIVVLVVVIILLAVGVFLWRKRQRQPILLTRDRPTSASSFGSVSDEWAHMRQSSASMPLGASAATMGVGGRHSLLGGPIRPPSAYQPKVNVARSPSTVDTHEIRTPNRESGSTFDFPPSEGYFPAHIADYPEPGSYTPFAIPPSSGHTSGKQASSSEYYASADTNSSLANPTSPLSPASPSTPSAEREFHTQFRLERKSVVATPAVNPFSDAAATRDSLSSLINLRPSAPSPLSGTFGPCHEPPPSSPFITGNGEDARSMRQSFITARTPSTPRLSAPPPPKRSNATSTTSTSLSTSADDFYSATSHVPTDNQVSSSDGHYITAPENPFADPQYDGVSLRASTVSTASIHYPQLVPVTTARGSFVPNSQPGSATTVVFPHRSPSVAHSIQSSLAHDPGRCQSPDEDELFYRPIKEFPDPPTIRAKTYNILGAGSDAKNPFNSQETVKGAL